MNIHNSLVAFGIVLPVVASSLTLRSAVGPETNGRLLLKAGWMTDTHVEKTRESCERVAMAYRLFRRHDVGLIINNGDIADHYYPTGYEAYRAVADEAYAGAGRMPPEIFVFAWHDAYEWNGPRVRETTTEQRIACYADVARRLRISHKWTDRLVVNGCTFLVFPQWLGDVVYGEKKGREAYEAMIAEEEAKANAAGRPLFVVDHVPGASTVSDSDTWGDYGRRVTLSRHPGVIHLSGHVHGSLRDENLIWQGGYTEVNAGCLQVWEGDSVGFYETKKKNYGALIMEVYERAIVFRRFDLRDGSEYRANNPWIVPWPFVADRAPYDPKRLAKTAPIPAFAPDARMTASTDSPFTALTLGLPRVSVGGDSTYRYRVKVSEKTPTGWSGVKLLERIAEFYLPEEKRAASVELPISAGYFTPGARYRFEAVPENFYGATGTPVSLEAVAPPGAKTHLVWQCEKPMEELAFVKGDNGTDEGPAVTKSGGWYAATSGEMRLVLPKAAWNVPIGTKVRVTLNMEATQTERHGLSYKVAVVRLKPKLEVGHWSVRTPAGAPGVQRYVFEFVKKKDIPYHIIVSNGLNGRIRFHSIKTEAFDEPVWKDDFASRSAWPVCGNYDGSLKIAFGAKGSDGRPSLTVTGTATGKCDTAWRVRSRRVALPRKAPKFELKFTEAAKNLRRELVTGDYGWKTMLVWYSADGREIGKRLFASGIRPGSWQIRLVDELPKRAAAFELQLGFDAPDMPAGTEVRFSELSFDLKGADAVCGFWGADATPPHVRLTSASPTSDEREPIAFSISDASGVAWERMSAAVDGKDMTAAFRRIDGGFAMARPATPWKRGLHALVVRAEDIHGNAVEAHKVFYVGEPAKTPPVTVRDDGVTLVDGEPFFPIGIYNVKRHARNGRDFDRAFAELGAAGFNFANSYRQSHDPEFVKAARRNGFRLFEDAKRITGDLLDKWRNDSTYLAWYVGDDTADHNTPQMIRDRDENLRAVDGTRITCQADYLSAPVIKDRYAPYAGLTDVFMPEIYPVFDDRRASNCVAEVVRQMKLVNRHNQRDAGGRACAVWPIIQNFKGWTAWKRYPTPEETTAMSFAALVHGAKGIVWYTYAPTLDEPPKGRGDAGIADDMVAWNTATNLSRRIATLAPVLLSHGSEAARVSVLGGPEEDAFGNPSVSGLVKHHGGNTYLLAVNSARCPVRATFASPNGDADVEVLWENRRIAGTKGVLADEFAPLGVHVYRWLGMK